MRESVQIDLGTVLAQLWRGRWWIVASVALFTIVAGLVAFLSTPIYRATVLVAPSGTEQNAGLLGSAMGQLGGIAELAGINLQNGATETEQALAVLRSREFTEAFIKKMNLMPLLFADELYQKNSADNSSKDIGNLYDGYRRFERLRSVAEDKKSGLIAIRVNWRDPDDAAAWANELVRQVNEEMQRRSIARADAYLRFLKTELAAAATFEAREAIGRLMESQIKQRMLASVSRDYAFVVVDSAMAPDVRHPVRPNKVLLLLLGPIAGFAVAIVFILVRWRLTGSSQG